MLLLEQVGAASGSGDGAYEGDLEGELAKNECELARMLDECE